MNKVKILIFTLAILLFGTTGLLHAEEKQFVMDGPYLGEYQEGMVTSAPYRVGDYWKIKIGKLTYTLMPECEVIRIKENAEGQQYEEKVTVTAVKQGNKVLSKIQGNRIFNIVIQ